MPCGVLAGALEPPLIPSVNTISGPGSNPQLLGAQRLIMHQAQLEHVRIHQQIMARQRADVQLYLQLLNRRRAQQLPVPSPAEISAVIANITISPPQMRQLNPRALDHYRVVASRNRLPSSPQPRCLIDAVASRRSSRFLVCMNPVIERIRQANPPRSPQSQVNMPIRGQSNTTETLEVKAKVSSVNGSLKRKQLDPRGPTKKARRSR